jgi:hypothetical protein
MSIIDDGRLQPKSTRITTRSVDVRNPAAVPLAKGS